ncbi:MAG: 2-oxo acid dehydrogenase subunit E2 [Actinomycetota bacterium]|nr:2-oxo acid dehydrogenase subunit E2 [Actinomycetota bacterium]
MPVSVTMPRLGESVSEGTVTRWLKQVGETVEADEPLLEVSTDKVDTEIPAPASGTLQAIKVNEDETVDVGVELALIAQGDEVRAVAEPAPPAPPAAQQPAGAPPAQRASSTPPAAAPPAPAPPASAPRPSAPQPAAPQASVPPQAAPAAAEQASTPPAVTPEQRPAGDEATDGGSGAGAYVTPLVRKLAAQHGVDLSTLTGTGVGGRIRKQDVLDAAAAAAPAQPTAQESAQQQPAAQQEGAAQRGSSAQQGSAADRADTIEDAPARAPSAPQAPTTASQTQQAAAATHVRGRTEKMSRLRQVIAQRMTESLATSAQLTTVVEVDVSRIAQLRQRVKSDFERREGVRLSFLPFFAIALIEALREYPALNSSIDLDAGTVTYHDAVHLGLAVDTERGLLVPVIHDAQDLNLSGMARKIADLAERTRSNAVSPDELGGGTFTLTNTGSRGALFDTPIINQPQVGILATGAVTKRPAVVEHPELGDVVAIRSMAYLSLTYDHRIVDGADAARALSAVKARLGDGAFEGDLGL